MSDSAASRTAGAAGKGVFHRQLAAAAHLLWINRAIFHSAAWVDGAALSIGFVYIFAGGAGVRLTVSNAVSLLLLVLFFAVIESGRIRRNAPGLSFLLHLPVGRKWMLVLFHVVFALPGALLFTVLFALVRLVLPVIGADLAFTAITARFGEALYVFLFMKVFVVNNMILVRIQYMLVAAHLLALAVILLALTIARDVLSPVYVASNSLFAVLFLFLAFALGFLLEKGVEI